MTPRPAKRPACGKCHHVNLLQPNGVESTSDSESELLSWANRSQRWGHRAEQTMRRLLFPDRQRTQHALFYILSRRIPPPPSRPRGWGVVYLVALGVVMAGSLALEWVVVRRGGIPWLPWILAGGVFVSIASGAWIIDGRTTAATTSAA